MIDQGDGRMKAKLDYGHCPRCHSATKRVDDSTRLCPVCNLEIGNAPEREDDE